MAEFSTAEVYAVQKIKSIAALLLALLLAGCAGEPAAGGFAGVGGRPRELTEEERAGARAMVDAQLGLLSGQVTEE